MTTTTLTNDQIETLFTEHDNLYDFARAIEQAVLQSEQVQAWKKDAERLHALIGAADRDDVEWLRIVQDALPDEGERLTVDIARNAIDAAMEKQK